MKTALLVLEVVVVLAALYSGTALVLRGRRAGGGRTDSEKRQTLVDLALTDATLLLMAVAAWSVYEGQAWARTMSIVAGALVVGALVLRPRLVGKNWWAVGAGGALGVAVVVLGILLPSAGG